MIDPKPDEATKDSSSPFVSVSVSDIVPATFFDPRNPSVSIIHVDPRMPPVIAGVAAVSAPATRFKFSSLSPLCKSHEAMITHLGGPAKSVFTLAHLAAVMSSDHTKSGISIKGDKGGHGVFAVMYVALANADGTSTTYAAMFNMYTGSRIGWELQVFLPIEEAFVWGIFAGKYTYLSVDDSVPETEPE